MSEFLRGHNLELEKTSPESDQAVAAVESQPLEPQPSESQSPESQSPELQSPVTLEQVATLVIKDPEIQEFLTQQNLSSEELTYLYQLLHQAVKNNPNLLTLDLVKKTTTDILGSNSPVKKERPLYQKALSLFAAAFLALSGPAAFKDRSASASAATKSKAATSTTETDLTTAAAEETPQMLSGVEVKLLTAYSNAKNYLDQYDALYSFFTLSDSQFKLFTEMLDYGIDDDEKNDPQFESLSLYYAQVLASLDRAEIERLTLLLQETTEKKWELYEAIFSAYGNEVLGYWEFSHQFEQSYWESEEAFQELDELYERFLEGKKLLKKGEKLKNWEKEMFDLLEEWSMKHKKAAIAAGFVPITEPPEYRAPTWNFIKGKPD